uniref:ClpX C4-type zinc finger protein n=1 Tax=Microbulbifer agarilyticus TaxID=260552 RepID=UPI0013038A14
MNDDENNSVKKVLRSVDPSSRSSFGNEKNTTHCNFCGRGPSEYEELVLGPDVTICDICVELSVQEINLRRQERE